MLAVWACLLFRYPVRYEYGFERKGMDGEGGRRINDHAKRLGLTLIQKSGMMKGWLRNAEKPMRLTWA